MAADGSAPTVSIVVPVYNNAAGVSVLLSSLRERSGVAVEAIVVDDGSQDDTAARAAALGATVLRNERNLGMTLSRNRGAEAARGEYVWFMDSDMELRPGVLTRAVEVCTREGLDGLMIPERSQGQGLWARSRNLEMMLNDLDVSRHMIRFLRRELFVKAGAFDPSLTSGEDYDFHARVIAAGAKYRVLSETYIYHHEVSGLRRLLAKYYRYGLSMPRYIRRHRGHAVRQFAFPRAVHFRHLDLLLRHPVLTAALCFFKACQYTAGLLGILASELGLDQERRSTPEGR